MQKTVVLLGNGTMDAFTSLAESLLPILAVCALILLLTLFLPVTQRK